MAHLCAVRLRLHFSLSPVRSPCIHTQSTLPNPGSCPTGLEPGCWIPSRATKPRCWEVPSMGGCICTGASLALHPPAPPPPHVFRARIPPNTPNLHRGDAGWPGHLVLLEVSLDRNAVLGVQCPEQGQAQDGEQCGLHGKAEPRAGGRALQCWRVCRAPIYGQALQGPPGSQPCLPSCRYASWSRTEH